MIVFVFSRRKRITHSGVAAWQGAPALQVWSYDRLFRARNLPRATYCFGDFDRLSNWECELAAHVFRVLKRAGAVALNDPARACQRFELLSRLYRTGCNAFRVWRLVDGDIIDRFPVFIRTASAHRGVETELLRSPEEVAAAAEMLVDRGIPERELMIVEYAAEEVRPGLFRKHAAYRVGERIVPCLSVHDTQWVAKSGAKGIAGEELYDEEHGFICDNRYADALMGAFRIARIDYGRADFTIIGGQVQIYEINTNPTTKRLEDHPSARRLASDRVWRDAYLDALRAVDSPTGPRIAMDDRFLARQRHRDGLFVRSRATR